MSQLTQSWSIANLRRIWPFTHSLLLLAAAGIWAGQAVGQPPASNQPEQRPAWMPAPQPAPIRLPGQPVPTPAPPALMPATEALDLFNPYDVQLSWQNRRWLLVHKGQVLKDFGGHYEEARQAQRLVQELGLNQHGVIGSPVPHLEYWLVDGHAPHALPHGRMRTFPLEAERLRVERVQNQWCVRDANRVLFNFAEHAEEAQQALTMIKKYQFAQVGFIGQVLPSMIVFAGKNQGEAPTLPAAHGAAAMARQMNSPRFSRLAKNPDGSPRTEAPRTTASTGYEGLVQPLLPPLAAPQSARPATVGAQTTLENQSAVAWRSDSRFGRQHAALGASRTATPIVQASPGGRVPFDWRQVQMRQDQGAWKLSAGSMELANFGSNMGEAQKALSAIRHYRFTEQYAAAGDGGGLPYYLAQGASPRGVMLGLAGQEFEPDKLHVQQQTAGYAICQGNRVVLQFRDRAEPARQALEAIQRQHLDRVCRIGEPGKEAMAFLVRSR